MMHFIKKAGLGLVGLALSAGIVNGQTGNLTGSVKTSLGDLPYNVENFTGTLTGNGNSYAVDVLDNGEFNVLGIPSAIEDITFEKQGDVLDIGGVDDKANIVTQLEKGLTKPPVGKIFDIKGRSLQVQETAYDSSTGLFQMFGEGYPSGTYIASITEGNGQTHTGKFIINKGIYGTKLGASLESITQKASLKSSGVGTLAASTSEWSYTLNITDPTGFCNPITITDISITDGQTTNLGDLVTKYVTNASVNVALTRDDDVDITNAAVVFKNPQTLDADTVFVEDYLLQGSLDLNKIGRFPLVKVINGYEEDDLVNPNVPFKTTESSEELIPSDNNFLFVVPKYKNEQVTLKLTDLFNDDIVINEGTVMTYNFSTQEIKS